MRALQLVVVLLMACSFLAVPPTPTFGPNRPPSTPVIDGPPAVTVGAGLSLTFTATSSDPEIYDELFWTWIWGDGTNSSTTGNATVPVSTSGHEWSSPGVYFVNVTVADGWSPPIPCASPVTVTVVPAPPGTLRGSVLAAELSPIANAEVVVAPGGHAARTNASGGYAFLLTAGIYSVTASASGYVPETRTGREVHSSSITTVNLTLSPLPGNIAGIVRSETGAPVAHASVTITTASGLGQITIYTLTTDDAGGFNRSVPSGTYVVTVTAPGYVAQNRSGVYVAPGQNVTVNFALPRESASTLSVQALIAVGGVLAVTVAVALLLRWRRKLT